VVLPARPWNPPLPPLELLAAMPGVTATVTTVEDALLLSMAGTAKRGSTSVKWEKAESQQRPLNRMLHWRKKRP